MKVYWTDLYSIEHRAYDNIDLNEEKQNEIVIEEKEKTIEEKFAFREQLFFYASLSLSVFALAVMVDLFWLVCWKKRNAGCEDRTHDLRIMRPTLFQLSQTRSVHSPSEVLLTVVLRILWVYF